MVAAHVYDDSPKYVHFLKKQGYLHRGDDLLVTEMTPLKAEEACASMLACSGFTFKERCPDERTCLRRIYFKKHWHFVPTNGAEAAYLKVEQHPPFYAHAYWWVLIIPLLMGICACIFYFQRE